MRYIIGALSVLLLIIGLTVTNSCCMSAVTYRSLGYATESLSAEEADDPDAAIRAAQTLDQYWQSKRAYLESVLMHAELDDITVTISDFVSAAENDDTETFRSSGRLLCVQLQHLADLEKLRIGNVL